MNCEERNQVYDGFTMVDVTAKRIIRQANNVKKRIKEEGGISVEDVNDVMDEIIEIAEDMEHRKQTYFTWLDEIKKNEERVCD